MLRDSAFPSYISIRKNVPVSNIRVIITTFIKTYNNINGIHICPINLIRLIKPKMFFGEEIREASKIDLTK